MKHRFREQVAIAAVFIACRVAGNQEKEDGFEY
jgi:hypothetical protein